MTQSEEPQAADYYQLSGGTTVGMTVAQEGEVVEGNVMGFSKDNPPLSEEEQEEKFGKVLYKEYTPDEEELAAIKQASGQIRSLMGMQHPEMPPVDLPPNTEDDVTMMSRQQLRAKAKTLSLNFPEDTDRDQMIGAIQKKLKEGGEPGSEPEAVAKRRETAKAAIEKNNEVATGKAGGSSSSSSSTTTEPPAEEEVPQ